MMTLIAESRLSYANELHHLGPWLFHAYAFHSIISSFAWAICHILAR
jgi:hypothetical protein